jgi:hypothetical protein
MPFFKTTKNILKVVNEDELFNPNWMDSDKLILPPGGPNDKKNQWDYKRELKIDDIDIWEVLNEQSGGIGLYAAWKPYAEFYLITAGWLPRKEGQKFNDRIVEYYYGKNAQENVLFRAYQLGIDVNISHVWVDDDLMWLYNDKN